MYWQIKSKYYSNIVRFNHKKKIIIIYKCILKNTSNKRKIIVDADTNEGRDIPVIRPVDGSASGRMGLRQASRSGKPTFLLAQRTIQAAVYAF